MGNTISNSTTDLNQRLVNSGSSSGASSTTVSGGSSDSGSIRSATSTASQASIVSRISLPPDPDIEGAKKAYEDQRFASTRMVKFLEADTDALRAPLPPIPFEPSDFTNSGANPAQYHLSLKHDPDWSLNIVELDGETYTVLAGCGWKFLYQLAPMFFLAVFLVLIFPHFAGLLQRTTNGWFRDAIPSGWGASSDAIIASKIKTFIWKPVSIGMVITLVGFGLITTILGACSICSGFFSITRGPWSTRSNMWGPYRFVLMMVTCLVVGIIASFFSRMLVCQQSEDITMKWLSDETMMILMILLYIATIIMMLICMICWLFELFKDDVKMKKRYILGGFCCLFLLGIVVLVTIDAWSSLCVASKLPVGVGADQAVADQMRTVFQNIPGLSILNS
ncbi:hypothetical protein NEHOM01_1838 [Nematocida homosporus]|uniref:uncharacterized protein n=1 Tax=Nematocida homosporus TaxID=1912981 RepID=UPI00221F2246|nr:uncharacterized protein NEHOM01_1838 [Nematocida homosporus]KAI5186980.1 hypothetical protein NEHOM01_1838 [Nematocida homosporus]